MEAVTGPIMLLKFDRLVASNTEMGLILSTIPAIVYTILNPVIGFKSDRHRGSWGRRIPFILFTLPFLVICLLALAMGDRGGFGLHEHLAGPAQRLAGALDARGTSFRSICWRASCHGFV
jgi:MFS family permease